eukprot:TRINITY_DN12260_c0_g1_i1.p2 TRINITY_DN12260_c0_g1~~TRINITY_DN12260_c0_g1_i1.p2  ORF type:complete len:390 (+),score=116.39 TRINITY_DN12260_c0_g1_i1:89-1171(+)
MRTDPGPRPNRRPLRLPDGGVDRDLAALRIQCSIRVVKAKRKVANLARLRWSLNRNALRLQKLWRAYTARQTAMRMRMAREHRRAQREADYAQRTLHEFKEGLIWRMALCESKATVLQRWWREAVRLLRMRRLAGDAYANRQIQQQQHGEQQLEQGEQRQLLADQLSARRIELAERAGSTRRSSPGSPRSPGRTPRSSAAGSGAGAGQLQQLSSPRRLMPWDDHDMAPPAGTLRPPIRGPPSSGVPNVNIRKEERERRELRMLETDLLVQHTRHGDHRFAIEKERDRLEHTSARQIQCMYRSRAAREVVAARALARQDHYMQVSPARGEAFGSRTVLQHPSPTMARGALAPRPPPPRGPP